MIPRLKGSVIVCAMLVTASAVGAESTYTAEDFTRVQKFDSHVHANTLDHRFLDVAAKDGFELLSINVDYPDFPALSTQAEVVQGRGSGAFSLHHKFFHERVRPTELDERHHPTDRCRNSTGRARREGMEERRHG